MVIMIMPKINPTIESRERIRPGVLKVLLRVGLAIMIDTPAIDNTTRTIPTAMRVYFFMEPIGGIEPPFSVYKTGALPFCYTGLHIFG
jgi:hypothetical protein